MNAAAVDRDEVIEVDDGADPRRRCRPTRSSALAADTPTDDRVVVTDRSMTNRHLAVRWDGNGNITSIIAVDAARELLPRRSGRPCSSSRRTGPCATTRGTSSRGRRDWPHELLDAESVEVVADGPLLGRVARASPVRSVERRS